MSVVVITWVYSDAPTRDVGEQAVLQAIADCAHDNGAGAFLSVSTIAWKTRMLRTSVQRILKRLRAIGVLQVEPRPGPGGTYRFVINPSVGLFNKTFEAAMGSGGASRKSRGGRRGRPDPSLIRQNVDQDQRSAPSESGRVLKKLAYQAYEEAGGEVVEFFSRLKELAGASHIHYTAESIRAATSAVLIHKTGRP